MDSSRQKNILLILVLSISLLACFALVYGGGALIIWTIVDLLRAKDSEDENGVDEICRFDHGAFVEAALGSLEGMTRLTLMCDKFGPRLSGTAALEEAIGWLESVYREELENVELIDVEVAHWEPSVRASLEMTAPWTKTMSFLELGFSVGTANGTALVAEVFVVGSFEELEEKAELARGRIVVWNVPFTTYGATVQYRSKGASAASRAGAVASLVRSVTPKSLYTPHTGVQRYDDDVTPIPAACITVEDAEMLARMQAEPSIATPVLRLEMAPRSFPNAASHNLVAEITGSESPLEVVVIGGHIDSWYVGQGSVDDAAGVIISFEALRIARALGIRPKRTVRAVAWTSEENGGDGGKAYRDWSVARGETTVLAGESDSGVNSPLGIGYTGPDIDTFNVISTALRPYAADLVAPNRGSGADISPLTSMGVPGMALISAEHYDDDMTYFDYHHTNSDTIDKIDPTSLRLSTVVFGLYSLCLANE